MKSRSPAQTWRSDGHRVCSTEALRFRSSSGRKTPQDAAEDAGLRGGASLHRGVFGRGKPAARPLRRRVLNSSSGISAVLGLDKQHKAINQHRVNKTVCPFALDIYNLYKYLQTFRK